MNANELADWVEQQSSFGWSGDFGKFLIDIATMLRNQQALIENLNGRIERMIENQSHHEAMEHAAGFEAGRQLGMKQEKALWELASSTQEIKK